MVNSDNANAFLVILEYNSRKWTRKSKNSSGFIRYFYCFFLVLGIAIFLRVFTFCESHIMALRNSGIPNGFDALSDAQFRICSQNASFP